jgi:DNA replication and repair protein RecF
VSELGPFFSRQHLEVTESREIIRFLYQPSFFPGTGENHTVAVRDLANRTESYTLDEIEDDFQEALLRLRQEEIRRGVTTIGPHRDDLSFIANDIDLHVYGSRGQIRSAVMSLKLAETRWFQEKTGELPVILLDETLAELDQNRRGKLLRSISNGWQAVFTTADLRLFSQEFTSRCAVWEVREGRITA